MPGARVWGDEISGLLHQDLVQSIKDEKPGLFPGGTDGAFQYSGLSLSGGGEHGAFGAGFLKGWSELGSRPTFKIVSGTSTGALIAHLLCWVVNMMAIWRRFIRPFRLPIFLNGSLF